MKKEKLVIDHYIILDEKELDALIKTIAQLKQQLAEKDKEIKRLKEITIFKDSRNMTTKINGVDFSDEQIIILQNLDVLKKYDQTQLAIQELEKLKNKINNLFIYIGELEDIIEKYGIDIQNLDYILEDYSKNQGRDFAICEERDTLRQERDTWKRACELACKTLEVPNGFCAERRCSDKMCYECLMETFYKRTSERN